MTASLERSLSLQRPSYKISLFAEIIYIMYSTKFIVGVILSFTTLSIFASSFQPPSVQRIKTSMSVDTSIDDISDRPGLTLGFIGCGTIASAIVTGLLTQNEIPISTVYVSRRSQSKSSALAQKYGDRVIICDDNQKIADSCGTLFVCVLPEKEEEIISGLTIGNDTTLVSLVVRFTLSNALFHLIRHS